MGSKNKPGAFDCYANAEPDEPMFILLARDKMAPTLVEMWADLRAQAGEDPAKVQEARDCAANMRTWRAANRPSCSATANVPRGFPGAGVACQKAAGHDGEHRISFEDGRVMTWKGGA